MKMCLTCARSVSANKPRNQHTCGILLLTITTMAVLLEAVDATANFNHRRLDDSGHASMDARDPSFQKHTGNTSSRTTALVEEVFGPSAVVEADESRRIYAISIPGIYPDDGPFPGRPSGYHPPVYRPQSSSVGHTDGGYPHFEGAQPPGSPPALPQNYWKSGLRLIVSGPADETELPIAPSAAKPSFEYSHGRQQPDRPVSRFGGRRPSVRDEKFTAGDYDEFTRQLDRRGNVPPHRSNSGDEPYSSAISRPNHPGVKARPLDDYDSRSLSGGDYVPGSDRPYADLRHEEERSFFRGDAFGGFQDYDDRRDYFGGSSVHQNDDDFREKPRGKLPSGFVLHGEPTLNKRPLLHPDGNYPHDQSRPTKSGDAPRDESAYSTIEDDYEALQNDKSEAGASILETRRRNEKPIFFNRPYPKLATPHNVAVLRGSEKPTADSLSTGSRDKLVPPIVTSVENEDKKTANPSTPDSLALDYYDDLYEEFMQSAYIDYYDNTPNEAPKSGPKKSSSSHRAASEEKLPEKILAAPDGRDVELVTPQGSSTRRDPPSDMYTTSRTVGLPATFTSADMTEQQSTTKSAGNKGGNTSERTFSSSTLHLPSSTRPLPSSTRPLPSSSPSTASAELFEEPISRDEVSNSSEAPKISSSTTDYVTTSGTSRIIAHKTMASSESPFPTTRGPSTSAAQHPYKSSAPTSTKISLSEILQNIGLSLPQFLVQLKIHKMDLKQFTNKLEKRSLTEVELKRAEGNLGRLLKILDETSNSGETKPTPADGPPTSERPTFKIISHDPELKVTTEQVPTLPSVSSTSTSRVSTTEEPSPPSENISSSLSSTTVPPKRFGFRPSTDIQSHGQFVISPNITSVASTENETVSSPNEDQKEGRMPETDVSGDKSEVTYRPYRRTWGDWKERMNHNRGVSSRLGTTTRRPKFRPAYSYNGGETELQDLIDKQNEENNKSSVGSNDEESSSASKESSIFLSKGQSTVIGLTEGTPLGGSYDHPRYDRDPNSLNIATRSAIMAAGVLGGIALAVFITIFVFVMYRNHVGKRRLRVPFPVSISSDESVSSTPELYGTRSRLGLGARTSNNRTDFWGTLKRKFDPYSLNSSTASYY